MMTCLDESSPVSFGDCLQKNGPENDVQRRLSEACDIRISAAAAA